MESTSYVLSFRMVRFYLVTTGWIFDICESSIKIIKIKKNNQNPWRTIGEEWASLGISSIRHVARPTPGLV